jgi:hypothetical protein
MEHAHPLYAHIIFCANPALMDAKTLISSLLGRANETCKYHGSNRTWASKQQLKITTILLECNVCNNNNRPQHKAASVYHLT